MLVFNPQLGLLLKEVISFQLNQLGLAGETIHRSLLRSVCSSSSLFLQSSLRCSSTWTCESVRKSRRILKQTQGSLQPRNRHFHLYRPPQSPNHLHLPCLSMYPKFSPQSQRPLLCLHRLCLNFLRQPFKLNTLRQ